MVKNYLFDNGKKERYDMKPHGLTMILAGAIAMAQPAVPQERREERVSRIPDKVILMLGESKAVLAYKEIDDAVGNGKTIAIVTREQTGGAPVSDYWSSADTAYSCELVILRNELETVRVVGRSGKAVDCESNMANRNARPLMLNDNLKLELNRVEYSNYRRSAYAGRYSYAFESVDGVWRLLSVEDVYSTYDAMSGADLQNVDSAAYPKDFGIIRMEDFDPDSIEAAQEKNRVTNRM